MSDVKIKICGLSRLCDIDAVNEAKPDYIGFVFAEKSRRKVDIKTALELQENLRRDIISVGVFVDENPEKILEIVKAGIIAIIQLHGSESEDYIKNIIDLTGKPVIKSAANLNDMRKNANYILFDTIGGGTGKSFDWGILDKSKIDKPFFLAGGLNIDNVVSAINQVRPFAVDISSGVETNRLKDRRKIIEFVNFVRSEIL
ncbi:MAG: phosphoribosylanthranilate isomerase [Oscillospiraceae bacterium]|nr:phosphoribosylanthranilate isomerase [Oscillospiraceae bacterium]